MSQGAIVLGGNCPGAIVQGAIVWGAIVRGAIVQGAIVLDPRNEKQVVTLSTLKKVLGYVKERYDYEDSTVIEFWERIYDHDPESLVAKTCFYHRCCYADIGNVDKRDTAKEIYAISISQKKMREFAEENLVDPKYPLIRWMR